METEVSGLSGSGSQNQYPTVEDLPSHIGEFLSSARIAQDSLVARQKILEQRLGTSEQFVDDELNKIQSIIGHFQNILSDAAAQEWRQATEALHKEGQQHAASLQHILTDIKKSIQETCLHLDSASSQMVKGLSRTLSSLHTSELEQFAEDSCQEVKTVAVAAVKQVVEIGRWFYWKNLIVVLFLSLMIALLIGLFIDDEWPWESHKSAVKERIAGQALLGAWPQLSLADQQRILSSVA